MSDNNINVTAPLHAATKKGKLGAAKEIFLDGDTQTVEKEIQDINSRHNDLSSKHESLNSTVSEHTKQIKSNQSQITANKSAQDEKNTSLDANMAKLNARDDQITELVKGVTATGGASVATAVTYDNTSSNLDAATVQGALDEVGRKTSDLSSKKANKVVRFDNAKKQYETDNKDVETANSHILEFYTDLVLSENERLVITNITYLKSNYYINISKFNSSTNTSEDVVVKQSQLIDNGVTILNTTDGEHSIFILFVSNGDTSLAINNIGQGIARMPYATEYAFSFNENKTILSYVENSAKMLAEQTRVNTELGKKFDKSSIVQESGEAEDNVMSQKAVSTKLSDLFSKKANKVVRFDNAKKQYETDNKDVETANSHILEFYTDLVLSENERLVITNITYLKSNYYINISKFNSSTNTSEDVVVKQSQLIDNGVTILNTTDGEHSIFILFVSNGDTSLAINNIGQGIARMPYATEYAFSFNENKTILSYVENSAKMLAEQTRVNTELGKKFDKSSIVQESGEAEDKVMSQKAVKKALEKIEIPTYNTQKSITVWGDSITWGSAASNSNKCYAMILKSLLAQNGVDADVVNCGVGGETFQNILVRQGAFGFYLSEDITLPHNKSEIVIQTITNYILDRKFKNTWYGDDSYFGLLLQGENGRGSEAEEYKTVNPIYANGHKCKMSYNGNQQNATINLCLDEDVTNDVIIKKGTLLYCHGNSFKSDISVFSIGTNDGWTIKSNGVFDAEKSAENYINMIDLAIGKAGTSKVIICSPYGGTALRTAGVEGLKVLESALAKHFGSRFFNWREYLVNYGLSDAGLSATEQDLKDINEGKCPSSLLSDGLHPNDKGHEVIGKMLYEIMKLNGFI